MSSFRFSGAFALALLAQSSSASLALGTDGPADAAQQGSDFFTSFGESAAIVPQSPQAESCRMKVVQYFSDTNLERINNELGALKDWSNDHYFYDSQSMGDAMMIAYEDTDMQESGVADAMAATFENVMRYHAVFNPGTEAGKVYLQDPQLAVGAIIAYTDYAEQMENAMRFQGEQKLLNEFQGKFSNSLTWLRETAGNTEAVMLQQFSAQCFQPK